MEKVLPGVLVRPLNALLSLYEAVFYLVSGRLFPVSRLGMRAEHAASRTGFWERWQYVLWLVWYKYFDHLAASCGLDVHCMNYGFDGEDMPEVPAHAAKWLGGAAGGKDAKKLGVIDTASFQLYLHLVKDLDLANKDVLEVSSGKGGGLAALCAMHPKAKSFTGIDLCAANVVRCNKDFHSHPGKLTFREGDAMSEVGTSCADVILNVEASHCYPSRAEFFKVVFAALRPGGVFCWTDFVHLEQTVHKPTVQLCRQWLKEAGFELTRDECVTGGVLRAMEKTTDAKVEMLKARVPSYALDVTKYFAATQDSGMYKNFADGSVRYHMFRAVKPKK